MQRKNIHGKKPAKQPEQPKQNTIYALSAICGILVSGSPIEESMGRIASITTGMMNAKACSIMLYDEENQELSVMASHGAGSVMNQRISLKSGASVYGSALKEKKAVTSDYAAAYGNPILPGTPEFSDIKSMVSAPMMYKNVAIGVINAYGAETDAFSGDEKITMQAIADQAAAAIQIERFRQEATSAKEALKDRKIVDKAKRILMGQRHMTEDQAYRAMRTKSMDTAKPMREIAEAIILTDDIKPG